MPVNSGGHRPVAELLEEALFGTADRLQLGAGIGEHRVGGVDELGKVHALGDPVEAADDDGAARQRVRNLPFIEPPAAIAGRQDVHRLVAIAGPIECKILLGDRRHEIDGVDEFAFQARNLESIETDGLAPEEQRLALGDLGAQAFLVIVRDIDQARPVAAAGIVVEHLLQRPARRYAVEHDAVPGVALEQLVEDALHAGRAAAVGNVRQARGQAAPARVGHVAGQPPDDMAGALAADPDLLGATKAQDFDSAARLGDRIDQPAGIDVLAVVARFGIGQRQPEAPGRPWPGVRKRCDQ